MKKGKKLLFIITVVLILMLCFVFGASAETYSGECGGIGDNVVWTFDTETGELVISGEGYMLDFECDEEYECDIPWYDYIDNIKSVVIGTGIKNIGDYAFYNCENLVSVSISEQVKYIGNRSFNDCINLSSLTIPNGVKLIEAWAFANCSMLNSITLPNSVIKIGDCAFMNCESISVIELSDNLETIGSGAFSDTNISSIDIPSSVTEIGDAAFYNCASLRNISLSDSILNIGEQAFYGTAFYNDASNWDNSALYIGNHLITVESLQFSEFSIKDGTISIAASAFYQVRNIIESVIIPDSVKAINNYAFENCEILSSVTFGNGIEYIGEYSFAYCCSIKSLDLPDSLITIDYCAFYYCKNLEKINIPEGTKYIGQMAFNLCTGLLSIEIPNSVERIEDSVFYDTAYYEDESNWENGVLYIGNHLIKYKNSSWDFYMIKEGTVSIADSAFEDNSALVSIEIPEGVLSIGDYVFQNCENLVNIIMPDSVKFIGYLSFVGTAYESDDSNWQNGALYIDKYLIRMDSNENSYSVESGTLGWADCIFYYSEINSLYIPDSITYIGESSFNETRYIYYGGSEEEWNKIVIGSQNDEIYRFTINFNCTPEECVHTNTAEYEDSFDITCGNPGYTAGVYCNDCEKWISGHEIIKVDHTDENYDSICDVCKSSINDISVGETKSIEILSDEITYLKYIPTISGIYIFESNSDSDTYGYLFDGEKNRLVSSNDDGGELNFSVSYYLNAGETYYWGAAYIDDGESGTFDVMLTYDSIEHTHTYISSVTKQPTCTIVGTTTYTCSCGDSYTETVKATGHKPVTDKSVAATCSKTGLTAGTHCSVCKAVITKQTVTAKKSHTSDKGTVTKNATYKATGTKTYKCTACETVFKTEEIQRLTLSKASGLKASSIKTTSIKFTWSKVTGAEKYEVYYSTNGKSWKKVTATKNSVTIKKLKSGTTYKVKVRAVAGSNKGSYSSVLTTSTKPSKVTLSSVKSSKKKTAVAAWKTVSGATGYEVVYSTSKKFTSKTTKKTTIKKQKTKKTTLKKLKSGKKYYVKVRAYKTVNGKKIYGSYSKVMTVKVK